MGASAEGRPGVGANPGAESAVDPASVDPSDTALGATFGSRRGLLLAACLILLACLPDAMLPPVLRPLLVERFGATEPQAHWFMSVNLVGALAAVPLLALLRRLLAPPTLVAFAAGANAALLAALALTPNLVTAMTLRGVEGAADMVTLAVLLDLAAKAGGPATQGRRLGLATTVLMIGLAGGAIVGGVLGQTPVAVLLLGAGICALVALVAAIGAPVMRRAIVTCPAVEHDPILRPSGPPLWTIALMMGSDRMLGGLLATTVPLLLASRFDWAPERVGGFLAAPLLLMALGAWPAGVLGDRVGNLFLRSSAAVVYALALAATPVVAGISGMSLLSALVLLGLAASALMPTSMALAARTGRGAVAMGTCHAAGNVGYLLGIAGAGWLLGVLGGATPSRDAYTMVIQLFALAHVVVTAIGIIEAGGLRRR